MYFDNNETFRTSLFFLVNYFQQFVEVNIKFSHFINIAKFSFSNVYSIFANQAYIRYNGLNSFFIVQILFYSSPLLYK